ncbi:MAG TPA: tRNA (adenosine(37)-N6)-threonylcarbamoyltransferase complex dimerization subunit type 1 TsaB [Gemmatimonadales bacterium]|nr:tRNA (adenosine(37)-N6)-threonylcarbamoyltransferase complex dimerization subunit type 1 TsaB [Gemmatimonadales bacterium]
MIALAIETATDRLSAALIRPGAAVLERHLEGARRHAAALLPMLGALLEESGTALGEVEALAIADGPGSFTGLRVGAAAVKALARTHPAMEVWSASTLMVRAAGIAAPHGVRVLVVTSALRGELYAACYRFGGLGGIETLTAPELATPESLHGQTPDLLVADAPDKTVERLADQFAVPLVRGVAGLPSAGALLALVGAPGGAERILALDDWEPTYGRPAEAQVKWETVHGRALPDSPRQSG